MYCPKCNTCYMDDGKFCQDCGAPLVQNSFYKEKKSFPPLKVVLAVVALCLAIAAGYALFKEEPQAPERPVKSPDSTITRSALRFSAGNPAGSGPAVRHRARSTAKDTGAGNQAAGPRTGMAAGPAAPLSAAMATGEARSANVPKGVGTPRAANTAVQGAGDSAHRDSPSQMQPKGQTPMVVIRDPLSAENRN
jgi:hypothetical protein